MADAVVVVAAVVMLWLLFIVLDILFYYLSVYIKRIQKVSYCFFLCQKYP